jgi:hypothetical protein
MTHNADPYDVFLCYGDDVQGLGAIVLMALEEAGLRTYRPWIADDSGRIPNSDPRSVLAQSKAVVGAVLSGGNLNPTLVVAIGAAQSLGKPVYIVTDEVENPDLPPYVKALSVFPLSRIDAMVRQITRTSTKSLSKARHAV